jgi:hypothetical protein
MNGIKAIASVFDAAVFLVMYPPPSTDLYYCCDRGHYYARWPQDEVCPRPLRLIIHEELDAMGDIFWWGTNYVNDEA